MAAPAVEDATVYTTPSADIVGNAFARQYYSILQQSPALVYRFYQDISRLGRPGENGAMSSTTSMDAINAKIQSYGSLKADIKFVDAQESYNGGVVVLVTGFMINADESRRGFTQTFFLAPQDKGFFVLNDLFRYVENDFHQNEVQDAGIAPTTPCPVEVPPIQENHIAEECNGEVCNSLENGDVPVDEVEEKEEPLSKVVDETPNNSEIVVESNSKIEDAPKKSYASIVMKDKPVTAPSPNLPKSILKVQEQHMPVSAPPVPVAMAAPSSENGSNHGSEGDGNSIYVKNLPAQVSDADIEEAFKTFGPIKSGGIQVRNQRGFYFGFVQFEVAGAAQSAIEASPITIAGREVVVEEKKSGSRGFSRGRFSSGRGGGGFKGEGGRGRGSYGGGRGYGRGESNRNDFENRMSGRAYQNRSEGYQRSDQNGNGIGPSTSGRESRGGGSGFRNMRAQRVPARA